MEKNTRVLNKTKKSLHDRIKSIISGLLCMVLLAVYAVPVSAGQYMDDMDMERTVSACAHVNIDIRTSDEYTMLNDGSHNRVHYSKYVCIDCGKVVKNYRQDMGSEHHSLSYNDLGHINMTHEYEIICTKCSYRCRTCIPCENEGSHKRPF